MYDKKKKLESWTVDVKNLILKVEHNQLD